MKMPVYGTVAAMSELLPAWSKAKKPVIGMLHLLPLPGAPAYAGNIDAIRSTLLRDAEALATGGVHGLMMENFGDTPFYPARVPVHVVAQMTAMACEVKQRFSLP